jgi:hypothetical protein
MILRNTTRDFLARAPHSAPAANAAASKLIRVCPDLLESIVCHAPPTQPAAVAAAGAHVAGKP